jgi:glutamate racemase
MPDPRPVGVFDSGIGGLSVLRSLAAVLPNEEFIYLADQARVPYGPRAIEEVRRFSEQVTEELLSRGVKLIVVACNTASAAALKHLRERYPVPFVGMEPAVKPAAETTRTGVVGVLATPATFQGELYASVVERFARDVRVLQHAPLGLVEQIEAGAFDSEETREILERALAPMLAEGIDTIVLGCTHYPFVIPQIEAIAGPGVRVIDPSPAVAAQTRRVLEREGLRSGGGADGGVRYLTTGDPVRMAEQVRRLGGGGIAAERVSVE